MSENLVNMLKSKAVLIGALVFILGSILCFCAPETSLKMPHQTTSHVVWY